MLYSVKRFSSPYSKDYEDKDPEEYLDDIERARHGREVQELDEEADRVRWRSSLKKRKSRKGGGAAILGGPGGIAGKWVGDRVAEVADDAGKSDEKIKSISSAAGIISGIGAGVAAGYALKRGIGNPADSVINKATKELDHFEKYRNDVVKFNKMSKKEQNQVNQEIAKRNQVIKNAQRRSNIGRYAMPVLGVVGAIGAAKAVSDSVSDRLSRRKAIDDAARDKKERIDQWEDFKGKAKNKIKRAGRYIKDIVTEDYRKEDKNSHEKKSNKK